MQIIPAIEPTQITVGGTISWSRALADYPAGTWILNYSLLSLAGSIQITSVASGSDHLISVDMATSSAYVPGTYSWQAWVTNGIERHQVGTGSIDILADYAAFGSGAADTRSHVKRVLDAIEAVIEGRASVGDQQLSIDGTTLIKMTVTELLALRYSYQAEYRLERQRARIAAGKNSGRKIVTRFNR